MGFVWTPITQLVTEVAAAHQNEIKTNVDIVYSDLALPPYAWVYLPAVVDEEIVYEDFKEMRDAIDYADDMNYCRSHDTGYNVDDKATHRATVHSSQKTGHDSTHDVGVDGDYDSGVHSGEKSEYQATYNFGVDEGHDSTIHDGVQSDYDSSVEATVHGSYDLGYNSGVQESHNTGHQ